MDVRLPDGTVIRGVPDGTTKADLASKLQKNGMEVPAEWLADAPAPKAEKPTISQVGAALRDIPRQVGLTARYGLEGAPAIVDLLASPFKVVTDAATGTRGKTASEMGKSAADWLGLPSPQGANERVVGDVSRLMAGAGGMGGVGRLAATLPGVAGQAGTMLAANPTQQLVGAAGAGGAGGAVREAGGSPLEQAGAALLGGVAAPMAVSGMTSGVQRLSNTGRKLMESLAPGATTTQNVDQQISLTLQRAGVDWSQVPERARQAMRTEVADALKTGGELNPAAVNRLLAFARTGTTPTRGMLTQDPVQITREQNLAKVGANSTDIGAQRLPRIQNENAQKLLNVLDDAGARNAPDAFSTGQAVIKAGQRRVDASQARTNSLYQAARDTQGRSAPLDGTVFTQRASQMLDEGLLGGALPKSVETHLNRIATGEVPFTVDYAEQLKTAMGKLQRASSDGQTRMALGTVRQALEETPLRASAGAMGQESIKAFDRARLSHRLLMQRVERTPALKAIMDGVEPDQFVKKFITGSEASVADVNQLRRLVGSDPQAMSAVRGNLAAHLKSAATNATEDVTKFSPAAYNKALNAIGDRKLSAFFSPEEIATLRDVGRAGTYMTAQPTGTAVNNSNSGALLIGRGLDLLDSIAGKLPLGLKDTIQGTVRGVQQGKALSVPGALLAPEPKQSLLSRASTPAILSALFATQPVD